MLLRALPHLIDLVAPPACGICGAWLTANESAVCDRCSDELPAPQVELELGSLSAVYAATRYTALVRDAIRALKFQGQPWRATPMGTLVARQIVAHGYRPDVILAVPLPRERLRARGYNQAGLIAQSVGRALGVRPAAGVLARASGGPAQSERSALERAMIGQEWQLLLRGPIVGRRILLIDDVITTGATVRTLCDLLLRQGAIDVCAGAVAWTPSSSGSLDDVRIVPSTPAGRNDR